MRHLVYGTILAVFMAAPALAQPAQTATPDSPAAKSQDKTDAKAADTASAKKDQKVTDVPKVAPDPPLDVDDITGNSARNAMGGGAM